MLGAAPLTYEQLAARVRGAAALLRVHDIRPGDRVAILSENMPQWGVAYFAIVCLGAVVVPVMTEFTQGQIGHILDHAGCAAVIVSRRLRSKLGSEPRPVLEIEPLAQVPDTRIQLPPVEPDDLAAVIYTSGTMGHSKGVMLTHRNIVFDAEATRHVFDIGPRDSLLSILTLAHSYECTIGLITALRFGASVTYLDRPPSASVLLPALTAVKPTVMLSVPLVIEKIYRSSILPALKKSFLYRIPGARRILILIAGLMLRRTFGGRIRFFGIGGAALAPDVERFLRLSMFPYAIGYGLTETSPLIAGAAPFATRPRSTGLVLPGVMVRIADPRPGTREGEIQVKGPNVMKGYFRNPERTADAFTPDGWLRTGDLGEFDRQGHLYIRGRSKTMILGASGENIYPEEIEAVINQSPLVDESLVYGDAAGVAALVQLKPDVLAALVSAVQGGVARAEHAAAELLERIRKEVNAQLAAFSRLHHVELQSEPFEKTPSQKIKRFLYPRRLHEK
jgi:long-chain acyl-CoA synthetase